MAKRMLADVLWSAANDRLCPGDSPFSPYTCDAVTSACRIYEVSADMVFTFLRWLGLPKDAGDRYDLFNDFEPGEERQGARYIWLLLAVKFAQDEGIEV